MAELFLELPSAKDYPDYYDEVLYKAKICSSAMGSTSATNAFLLYRPSDLSRLQNLLRLGTLRKRLIRANTRHWRRLRRISTRCSTTQSSTTRKARMSISMPRNCNSSFGNRLARTDEEGSQKESAQENTRTSFRRSSIMARSIKSVRFMVACSSKTPRILSYGSEVAFYSHLSNGSFYSNAMQLGDFVHIRNDNDPSKPIIGLIFSLWEDAK